ncbi:MAG: glycine betaine ABC transporter substrate-binding protein [Roseovarius sp.]
MKLKATTAALALTFAFGAGAAQACELDRSVKLADGNWDAVQVFNSIAAMILEKGYDCEAEMVTGGMVPLFTALGKGDLDVFMDVWIPNNEEIWAETKAQGAVELGVMYDDATEGWYVPRFVVEGDADRGIEAMAPDLKSVEDLAAHWELFQDPEEPGKGRFLNCPIGWGCEQRNNAKLEGYGLTETFVNFKPGTGAALDSAFAAAAKRGKPVVGYYWAPTWLLGVHDMVKLEEPACTETNADACAFSNTPASVTASAAFVEEADALESFFANYKTSSAEVSAILAYMQENEGSTREDAAKFFLENYQDTWTNWVPADVAEKVKASL